MKPLKIKENHALSKEKSFWLDFGDLSPMILFFFRGLTYLRHFIFSGGTRIMGAQVVIVNGGSKLIRQ